MDRCWTFHNQPLASTTLASTVWTKRNGKQVAVHHQETDLMTNQLRQRGLTGYVNRPFRT
jgi:hypothetical protein